MIERMDLVKSAIYDFLSYNFQVYRWSSNLLKHVDKWVRNFIWTSDINK